MILFAFLRNASGCSTQETRGLVYGGCYFSPVFFAPIGHNGSCPVLGFCSKFYSFNVAGGQSSGCALPIHKPVFYCAVLCLTGGSRVSFLWLFTVSWQHRGVSYLRFIVIYLLPHRRSRGGGGPLFTISSCRPGLSPP